MPDGEQKPEIINYYNKTKAGVDVLDKLVRAYSCKRSTRRWTVSLFFNVIDIAALNALGPVSPTQIIFDWRLSILPNTVSDKSSTKRPSK